MVAGLSTAPTDQTSSAQLAVTFNQAGALTTAVLHGFCHFCQRNFPRHIGFNQIQSQLFVQCQKRWFLSPIILSSFDRVRSAGEGRAHRFSLGTQSCGLAGTGDRPEFFQYALLGTSARHFFVSFSLQLVLFLLYQPQNGSHFFVVHIQQLLSEAHLPCFFARQVL